VFLDLSTVLLRNSVVGLCFKLLFNRSLAIRSTLINN